ncbi:MAG TPA: FdtA/QdtA family cupin domain-containing protein [Blastocatellia bacterium]|nr:FdtA/QdtA family cupin domain-containing protein [Blastocatellia bacterium]
MRLLDLPVRRDPRGSLCFAEYGKELPFVPMRYFVVFDVPPGQARGGHAHRRVHQFLVCVRGSCVVSADDGADKQDFLLDSPSRGLHLPPLVWASQHDHSPDAILLVLSSEVYEEEEYIRDYQEFKRIVDTA